MTNNNNNQPPNEEFDDAGYLEFDKRSVDIEELGDTNIKINPSYYIHFAIINAQQALKDDNIQRGFLKFRVYIEHAEILAKASGMLAEDYEEQIKAFTDSEEYKAADINIQNIKLANHKCYIILKEFFASRAIIDSLKLK